jgi:hypothetical protein
MNDSLTAGSEGGCFYETQQQLAIGPSLHIYQF